MPGRSFLDLLIEGASVEALERQATVIRTQCGESRDIERELSAALAVRSLLEQHARREQELAALFATAGDLSSLRDLDSVLAAIVRRARQLLGTDAAYLTLMDEAAGDTYMRTTAGIRTEAFKRVRLDMGAGLGGYVAQRARPYATSDYCNDPRLERSTLIDAAVIGEGLVAILGVPLALGRRVIGVLFAANRRERPFLPEEVSLLSSLAAHAAIAIENARLFQEAQTAVQELTAANEIIQANSEAIERAAALHERLSKLVLEGGEIADVAAVMCEAFEASISVVDGHGRLVAAVGEAVGAGEPGEGGGRRITAFAGGPAVAQAIKTARSTGRSVLVKGRRSRLQRWVTPILAGSEHLGALVCGIPGELKTADIRGLERGAQVTALLMLNERSVTEAELRVRGELFDELFSGTISDIQGIRRRSALLGVDLEASHVVVVVRASSIDRRVVELSTARLAAKCGGFSATHDNNIVLLIPGGDVAAAAALATDWLRSSTNSPFTAGVAGPASEPIALAASYREAVRCQSVLVALGREGQCAAASDLGVYGLLLGTAGGDALRGFLRTTLGPVLDHDSRHNAELTRTLEVYLDCSGSLARTSSTLLIHVNTLRQRLERIDVLLGRAWRDSDVSLQLHIALRIRRLGIEA